MNSSLTLRLAALYAASTLLILLAVAVILLRVIEHHFVEQDVAEMRGKLDLVERLIDSSSPDELPFRLDDALVGHHHLSLALLADGKTTYHYGPATLPPAQLDTNRLLAWQEGLLPLRGLARALPGGTTVVVAVDTTHHQQFIDNFTLALWAVLALGTAVAAALGWLVAKSGLAPLRHTAQLAHQITAEQLDRRLPTKGVPAELAELTLAFNAMLDRLKDSFERLSAFSADLAHEMRTPVNNLMMQSQVMLTQTRSAEAYRDVLASNLEEFERLARMIGDMLFLAKADNGLIVPTREAVDLAGEVAGLFEFFEALAEDRDIRLSVEGSATVSGDRLMLRRALANLLSNALRYAPAGSTVRVAIEPGADDKDGVAVHIDNVCTTPLPQPLDRLFERFHRADAARQDSSEGAGLGLAIVRSIVHAHGGTASATALSSGIRFTLCLPQTSCCLPHHART